MTTMTDATMCPSQRRYALARIYPAQASTIRETREMAARSAAHWARVVDLCFRGCVEVPA